MIVPVPSAVLNTTRFGLTPAVSVPADGSPLGTIVLADRIKATTPGAIRELQRFGLEVVMVTGDHLKEVRYEILQLRTLFSDEPMAEEDLSAA